MRKTGYKIESFAIIFTCYLIVSLFVTISVLFFVIGISNIENFKGILGVNLITYCFSGTLIFIPYYIISFLSQKSAKILGSFLFSLMILIEIGLIFYYESTGTLMGNEIIIRPLWETLFTIKSNLNIWRIIEAVALIVSFVFISSKISDKHINKTIAYFIIILMILSAPLFFVIKPRQDKSVINKTMYCIHSCLNINHDNTDEVDSSVSFSKTEYDRKKIERYKKYYPERKIINNKYPLERKDNIKNVLGPLFNESEKKPNIVIIIVESLGSDIFGQNDYNYTFTPFLDSLSKHSLLWTNCLSSTIRSFGAIPSITASVPYGTKGFQFRDMPEHNSLFSILKDNGYYTSSFYAGNYFFDNIYDYLLAEGIDYMSPFYEESTSKESRNIDKSYWGFHDKVMFDKSMEIIKQRDRSKSYFDLFTTISQHDNYLKLRNKEENKYYNKVKEIISALPENEQELLNKNVGFLAACMYGDDAIRSFFNSYKKFGDIENSIFIITGDHSLNLRRENPMNGFHVPLIIWSPLLNESGHYKNIVSHNDIVPSMTSLLKNNYNINTPNTIHYVGDGLDTIKEFKCDINTYFLGYIRKKNMCVYNGYFYTTANNYKQAYKIKENIVLEEVFDEKIIRDSEEYNNTMAYIDNYTYTNNKITENAIFKHERYVVIENIEIDSVTCHSLKEKPSKKAPIPTTILSKAISTEHSKIRIMMTADIKYTGRVWQDTFINLFIELSDNKEKSISSHDNISKNITSSSYTPNEWFKMEVIKTIELDINDPEMKLYIYMLPPNKDHIWNPDHSVSLKDIKISILGVEDQASIKSDDKF